ncbi:CaiB/BaiF CoA transferase family protein [Variovorax ureilyticus]|uniref:CaiB/BaiF CoA transferase family protein n=1 Tax=Variovorax ureilyticus TaxID=1836198 RepID=UPI003D67DBFF
MHTEPSAASNLFDQAPEDWLPPVPGRPGALADVRVLDASRVLGGPLCAQILGDHGADVLKVEGPEGDETRNWGPPFAHGQSAYFTGLNRNKRSLCLDLSTTAGRARFLGLLEKADVLVENFKPSTSERWGLTAEALRDRFPALIHCSVTGFGGDGPLGRRPAYDTAMQALCGIMSVNGEASTGPQRTGLPVVDMTTALNAAIGVLLALHERSRSGLGQRVEAALYDSALSLLHPHAANYLMNGVRPRQTGNAHPSIYPYDSFSTKGGLIYLAVGSDKQFARLCECLGRPSLAQDGRFSTNAQRSAHRDALREILVGLLAETDGPSLCEALIQAGVPCAPVMHVDQALSHPHTLHRNMVVGIGDAYRGLGSPVVLDRTPATYRYAPPLRPNPHGERGSDPSTRAAERQDS